jgi:hypothetical protein
MNFNLGHVEVHVTAEGDGVRLRTSLENISLSSQTFENIKLILTKNFEMVRTCFQQYSNGILNESELDELTLKVIFRYMAMYNNWKTFYPKERDRDLTFILKDLNTPMAYDLVTEYIKTKYRKGYQAKCAQLLGISKEEYLGYEKARKEFMDRR